ncbi:hypothetical protein [Rhodococcus sp. Leaf247]|uniref:hypothetical protein n=1 Tax=Rhodococcus sp. Leaf247 TaxID=1736307 RepID=UPI0012E3C88A|nr:hypothetical protein [Rhodococcus sp. Leaf247]
MNFIEYARTRLFFIVALEIAVAVLVVGALVEGSWWISVGALAVGVMFGVIYLLDRRESPRQPAEAWVGPTPTGEEVDRVVSAEQNEVAAIRALRVSTPGLPLDVAKRLVAQSLSRGGRA